MTIFNRVFQKQMSGNKEEPATPENADSAMPATTEAEAFDIYAQLSALGQEPTAVADEQPSAPPPGVDPALVARAAEAHRMMVQSQLPQPASPAPAPVPQQANAIAPPDVPPLPPQPIPAAAPAPSRTRTRLLGFDAGASAVTDPFETAKETAGQPQFPCGWLVVTKGPGLGASFALHAGVAMVGRGDDQAICLDFGDRAISRQNHAAVAYDTETGKFFLGHGGKSNIIRLNGGPVLSTETLAHGDTIRIGETELRFAAFCDETFNWAEAET